MNISLFLKGKELHVVSGNVESIYVENETRNLADNIPAFLSDIISKSPISNLENLIYSSGPCSFTSIRVINSIVKAFSITFPTAKFLGVSHFLTYLDVLSKTHSKGSIAIPTMRGDYFISQFDNNKLSEINVGIPADSAIFENSELFSGINLAKIQLSLLDTPFFSINPKFLTTDLQINYGFTPEYSH